MFLRFLPALLALACTGGAVAQSYPDRPVKLVVGFPPGGPADLLARIYADRLGPPLGQSVVIENKAGAAGAIAGADVAKSPADGYTLLFGTASTHGLYPLMAPKPLYDPLKDFVPIAVIGAVPVAFAAKLAMPDTLKAVLDRVRAEPGKLTYGSPGAGTYLHMTMELLRHELGGLEIKHVAYRGSAPAMTDLVGGHIDLLADTLGTSLAQHQAKTVRILAVTTVRRTQLAADVPTVAEALGLKSFEAALWSAPMAPAGTPAPVLAKLATATQAALSDPRYRSEIARHGIEPTPHTTPDAARAFIEGELKRWQPVVKATGVTMQ